MLVIEGKASGHSVYQEIERRQDYRKWGTTLMDTGRLDKTARVYSVQGLFSQGLIWAPDRDWATKVIEQFSAFPKARNDDLVDASCQALRTLRDMGMLQFQDEREYEEYYENNKPVSSQPLYPV
jgi:predicted phage terminase large subunit-like protein